MADYCGSHVWGGRRRNHRIGRCFGTNNNNKEHHGEVLSNQNNGLVQFKKIALVFAILLEVDNQKLNLQNFVNEYFYNPEGYNVSYSNFSINVLVPFKNSVATILGVNFDGTMVESEVEDLEETLEETELVEKVSEPDSKQKILFANLRMSLNELLSVINRSKVKEEEKEELRIIINAIFEAIKIENLTIINALVIPLE